MLVTSTWEGSQEDMGLGRGRGQLGCWGQRDCGWPSGEPWRKTAHSCPLSGQAGWDSILPGGSPWWAALGSCDLVRRLSVDQSGSCRSQVETRHWVHCLPLGSKAAAGGRFLCWPPPTVLRLHPCPCLGEQFLQDWGLLLRGSWKREERDKPHHRPALQLVVAPCTATSACAMVSS